MTGIRIFVYKTITSVLLIGSYGPGVITGGSHRLIVRLRSNRNETVSFSKWYRSVSTSGSQNARSHAKESVLYQFGCLFT